MTGMTRQLYNALIRTHHITSRKKVAKLRTAADKHGVYALLRSGGCPGIMYIEGSSDGVAKWVSSVNVRTSRLWSMCRTYTDNLQRLRYKDYQLAVRPASLEPENGHLDGRSTPVGLFEVGSVKGFGAIMQQRGVWSWWRKGMGYVSEDN